MKKIRNSTYILMMCSLLFLASCSSSPQLVEQPTSQELPTQQIATLTPRPETNPTVSPSQQIESPFAPVVSPEPSYLAGTPLPVPESMISPENLTSLQALARWGNGTLNHITVSPDESILAAASSLGIYVYDAGNGELINFIDTVSWINVCAISPDSQTIASGAMDGSVVLWNIQSGTSINDALR